MHVQWKDIKIRADALDGYTDLAKYFNDKFAFMVINMKMPMRWVECDNPRFFSVALLANNSVILLCIVTHAYAMTFKIKSSALEPIFLLLTNW